MYVQLQSIQDELVHLRKEVSHIMTTQAQLDQKLTDLNTSIDALVAAAKPSAPPAPVDLTAEADHVDALKSEVDAATAALAPASTPAP